MLAFWLSIAALTLLTLVVMFWPWIVRTRTRVASQAETNIAIYRGEREQTELDFREGRLSAAERDTAIAEIEGRIIEDVARLPGPAEAGAAAAPFRAWPAAAGLTVLLPAAAIGLYMVLGNPAGPPPGAAIEAAAHQGNDEAVRRLADQLAERLKSSPDDTKGWILLARTNHAMGRFDIAAQAYARATQLDANNADLYADWAELLVQQSNGSFAGRPTELARRAIALDPNHTKAIALLATAAWSGGDPKGSLALWQRLLALLPPDSEDATQVKGIVAQITGAPTEQGMAPRTATGTTTAAPGASAAAPMPAAPGPGIVAAAPPAAAPPAAAPPAAAPSATAPPVAAPSAAAPPAAAATPSSPAARPAAPAATPAITGTISIKPDLRTRLAPGDTLYVFARASEGPRMPLAVIRTPLKDLPFQFRLDDSLAMTGGPALSSAANVVIEARISKTGEARPQSGDLFGRSPMVAPGASGVTVVIDGTVP